MDDENQNSSDVAAAYEHGTQQAKILEDKAGKFQAVAIIPQNTKTAVLHRAKTERPEFLIQKVHFSEVEGFVAYVDLFKNDDTVIFKDNEAHSITAIFDYHQPSGDNTPPQPRHGEHVAVFYALKTDEWLEWINHNDEAMGQVDFAEFIEDHAKDFVTPDSATMCDIATTIQAKQGVNFKQSTRMENGAASLVYEENIDGSACGGSIEIPKRISLALRPFEGCNRYALEAMFRYKISGGGLKLRYKLIGHRDILNETFKEMAGEVEKKTGIMPLYGSLE